MKNYTVKEIAEMLRINPETVRRWIRDGKLQSSMDSKFEGNYVSQKHLNDFLKKTPKYALPLMFIPQIGIPIMVYEQLLRQKNKRAKKEILESAIESKMHNIKKCEKKIARLQEEIKQDKADIENMQKYIESNRL